VCPHDRLTVPPIRSSQPPPVPKPETKWEKFAREKGIALNKNKRSQKVWDEATGEWKYRHGYNKANDDVQQKWPIMEVKDGDDPFDDPWHKQRQAKRAKVERNLESRLKNQERSGALPKGTTNQIIKGRAKAREAGIAAGNLDRDRPPPGVPVDLKAGGGGSAGDSAASKPAQRGKASTAAALSAVQRSTASLGKFDKMREGEPDRKKASVNALKKRKRDSATPDRKALAAETERGLKVLKSVVEGGGAAKERAIKKGKLAKGETAYDYDYDDGLGASSFRKKKGRAGAGKMKKMTKKRAR
jgi:regulator of ribosome biosynthesis